MPQTAMSDAAAGAAVRTATPPPRQAMRMRSSPQVAGRPPAPSSQAGLLCTNTVLDHHHGAETMVWPPSAVVSEPQSVN